MGWTLWDGGRTLWAADTNLKQSNVRPGQNNTTHQCTNQCYPYGYILDWFLKLEAWPSTVGWSQDILSIKVWTVGPYWFIDDIINVLNVLLLLVSMFIPSHIQPTPWCIAQYMHWTLQVSHISKDAGSMPDILSSKVCGIMVGPYQFRLPALLLIFFRRLGT